MSAEQQEGSTFYPDFNTALTDIRQQHESEAKRKLTETVRQQTAERERRQKLMAHWEERIGYTETLFKMLQIEESLKQAGKSLGKREPSVEITVTGKPLRKYAFFNDDPSWNRFNRGEPLYPDSELKFHSDQFNVYPSSWLGTYGQLELTGSSINKGKYSDYKISFVYAVLLSRDGIDRQPSLRYFPFDYSRNRDGENLKPLADLPIAAPITDKQLVGVKSIFFQTLASSVLDIKETLSL